MPWTAADVDKHISGLSRREKRRWAAIANSALKKCIEQGGVDCEAKAIRMANGVLSKAKERELMAERTTKKIDGKEYPASCFLVVGDPEKPTTWHLPVKDPDGTPNRKLAAAAWAALFSPGGHRGNKYAGPDKEKARAKLKALYKANDWEMPGSAEEAEKIIGDADLSEYGYDQVEAIPFVPSGIVSFEQLDDLQRVEKISYQVRELTGMYTQMVSNIVYWYEGDKIAQLEAVADEFVSRLGKIISNAGSEAPEAEPEYETSEAEQIAENEPQTIPLSESESGQVVSLVEAAPGEVLMLDAQIIRPGWGNRVDNNYYPADMLRNHAQAFIGAKMYETDHRPDEKSTRTWVSTVTDIVGFTEEGAPIGRIAVHDPSFAQRVRNLASAGLLDKLECSIYAQGKAERNFELDGRKGQRVVEIMDVESVDWVTKAGAGGKALALAENNRTGGDPMEGIENAAADAVIEQPAQAAETAETAVVTDVAINESEQAAGEGVSESSVEALPLSAEAVRSLLESSGLPPVAQSRLAEDTYATEDKLSEAIEKERSYLRNLLSAGRVTGMGETSITLSPDEKRRAVDEAANRVLKKYFGG